MCCAVVESNVARKTPGDDSRTIPLNTLSVPTRLSAFGALYVTQSSSTTSAGVTDENEDLIPRVSQQHGYGQSLKNANKKEVKTSVT